MCAYNYKDIINLYLMDDVLMIKFNFHKPVNVSHD